MATAMVAARSQLELLRGQQFSQVFALFNHDAGDDPAGAGTAPGPGFEVPGLSPCPDDLDGLVGEIRFSHQGPDLRENAVDPELDMPRDLNGDLHIDQRNHADDYHRLARAGSRSLVWACWRPRVRVVHHAFGSGEAGRRAVRSRRAGFTVLELLIAVVIVGLIAANVSMVLETSSSAYEAELLQTEIDDQSSLAIDRIRLALMSSSLKDLNPDLEAGGHSSQISYRVSLGLDANNVMVYEDPELIQLESQDGTIVWVRNPQLPNERSMVWTKNVPNLLRGELPNGDDDNQNNLADEEGLVFQKIGQNVHVQLSVERTDSRGVVHSSPTRSEIIFCRN